MVPYKLIKKPFFGRYQKPWRWPLGYTHSDSWETVSFASKSQAMLSGLYGDAQSDDVKGNIVLAHPMGISAKGYFLKNGGADQLRLNGYNVLLFDINGFGNSTDGDYKLFEDILAAGFFIQSKNVLKTGIYGVSFGASMALCAFSRENNPYTSAVFESAFTSLREFWSKYRFLSRLINFSGALLPKIEKEMNALHNVSKVKNTEKIFWIYGDSDTDTPPEMGHRFQKECNIESDMWIVPNGTHAKCYDKAPELYFSKLLDFFNATL